MINKAIKHTPDLREEKVAALYRTDRTAHAWRPHAALREVIAGNAIRDLAGRDISFDVNGGGSL